MIEWPLEKTVEWLCSQVSLRSGYQTQLIDPDEPLSSYGFTSLEAITLTAELEELLGIRIDPTVVWDYPSINGLVSYLYREQNNAVQSE